jgi:hypothetical protein
LGGLFGLVGLVCQIFPSAVIEALLGKNALYWMGSYRLLEEVTLVVSVLGICFSLICRVKCFRAGRFTRLPFWMNFIAIVLSLMPFL